MYSGQVFTIMEITAMLKRFTGYEHKWYLKMRSGNSQSLNLLYPNEVSNNEFAAGLEEAPYAYHAKCSHLVLSDLSF